MKDLADIVKTVDVPLPPDEAFRLFTEDLAAWWPMESHSLSAFDDELPKTVEVEPKEGGKVLEERQDGSRHPWGTITAWEPGHRFAMDWHVGRPAEEATKLDVRFMPHGNGTRVSLTHGGWTALGAQASGIHKGYFTGWDLVFGQCYFEHCAGEAALTN
ncbi:MAG: SRPBCC domain-containing protein [Pseudomonadota bacterium]